MLHIRLKIYIDFTNLDKYNHNYPLKHMFNVGYNMERSRQIGKLTFMLCSLVMLFFLFYESKSVYNIPYLLLICRTLFAGIIPLTIAVLSARAYLENANVRAMLMGCGMLVFGLGSLITGFLSNSPNTMITIYNTCAFTSSVFHLLSATLRMPEQAAFVHNRKIRLVFFLSSIVLFATIVSLLAYHNLLPIFFDKYGSTRLRDVLLWLTIAFYLGSSIALYRNGGNDRLSHLFWYSLALLMLSIGLFGVAMIQVLESPLNWAGRICQYVGCVFALVSMIEVLKKARKKGVSPTEFMSDFFVDAESNYRILTESISSAIIVVNGEYKVFFSNTAAQRLFRVSGEEFLNMPFFETILPEHYRQSLCDEVDSIKKPSRGTLHGQTRQIEAMDRDGRVFPVELSFSLSPLASGYACTFVIHDITERVNQQQKQKLVAQAEELQRKNRLLTDFFTNISHEFKTPLTLILNTIELSEMRIKAVEFNKEKYLKNLSVMRQNANRLLRLIVNLLDVTKIDAGFMQLYYQMIDLPQWMEKLVQSVEDFATQRGIEVMFHDESEIQFFHTDGDKLDRIMLNLLSNAIKHTGRGGHIGITLSDSADKLLIAIQDNGEGIPENKQNEIFNRFHQVNTSLTRSSEGSGIGLALTKALVDLLHGRIWFTSKPGEGTTFFVELPVTEPPDGNPQPVMDGLAVNRKVEMEFSDIM